MTKTISQKMGIKDGMRTFFMNAPQDALTALHLPTLNLEAELQGAFDYIHFFTLTQADMERVFPELKRYLEPTGMLWVSWPKGKKLATDLTLPTVIKIGYTHGLVESTCLSVDTTWSGLKFTHPKEGKVYKNSFGQLPSA